MAKKRKRRNKGRGRGCLIGLFVTLLVICLLVIAALKLTEKITTEIDLKTYPLEHTDIIYKYADE